MSSQQSSSSSSRPALPRAYFSKTVQILRQANARYAEAAASFRRAYQPTHHARKRAQKLQLSVSIDAAKAIDPRQVSVIPLPVLATPLPALEPAPAVYQTPASRRGQRPALEPLTIPSMAVVGREREIKRLSEVARGRPVLRCDIPQDIMPQAAETLDSCVSISLETPASEVNGSMQAETASLVAQAPSTLRGQNVPWRPVTSRWSMTDSDKSIILDTSSIQTDDGESSAITYSSDYDESMTDLETCSPIVAERVSPKAGRVVFLNGAAHETKQPAQAPSVRSRKNPSLRLDAPMDITDRYSWSSDIPYSAIMGSGNSTSSSSSSSAGGPITPDSEPVASSSTGCPYSLPLLDFQVPQAEVAAAQPRPRVSSVKRKCSESFIDMSYGEGETRQRDTRRVPSAEKRAKYQRKHWMNPAAAAVHGSQRTVSSSTSASGSVDADSSFWQ